MTIAQLIRRLQMMAPDMEVYLDFKGRGEFFAHGPFILHEKRHSRRRAILSTTEWISEQFQFDEDTKSLEEQEAVRIEPVCKPNKG